MLSSVDIIAFNCSLNASQHYDHPRVSGRVAKAEETRIWQTAIPDARIEEIVAASRKGALRKAKQYKWVSSDPLMQSRALLGMRRPDFDGNTAPVRVLYSRSKQVNQDALSVMLPQLEQSKDKIMEWMACNQASLPIPKMTRKITGSFANQRFRVPQATNYHPRVFKHPYFTTGDLVAGMVLAAESRQKGHADAFKFFKLMGKSFLPSFSVNLGATPTSSAGKPKKAIYLYRPFQYVPAGADLAFYFDGNRGTFWSLSHDSIVLNRPEDIVDDQQHAALVLSSSANVDACSLEVHQTSADIAIRSAFCGDLEKLFDVQVPFGITEDEAQAIGVSTIRSFAACLERDSFLETQRKVLESKPKLLIELLPPKLVKLVIDYFNDDTYPFIVSTHRWPLKNTPVIAVDSARVYVVAYLEGIKGLSHSLDNTNEDERCYIELGDPQWLDYLQLTSSYDGRYVSFSHTYKVSTNRRVHTKRSIKWLTQDNELEGEKFKRVAFDGENLAYGLLSRDGQTAFAYAEGESQITRVYRITEEEGGSPTASLKFTLNGIVSVVSGKGNRVIVENPKQLGIHDISKDASKLVCQINRAGFIYTCALNNDGSKAAFFTKGVLQIAKVDKVVGGKVYQPEIVIVKVPESLGSICQLVYSDENKLHVLHDGGKVSLFDPSTEALIPIGAPQERQRIIRSAISPNADYVATLRCVGNEVDGKCFYRTVVKRKLGAADWKNLFGYEPVSSAKSSVLPEKALTQVRNALPQNASRIRLTTIAVKGGSLCAFDGSLTHRYVLGGGWVVHLSAVDGSDDRGSVKLPASLIKGVPQHLQTNSDGTVFYVATKRNNERYIYVINVANKSDYEYRLENLESDIAEMKVHSGGKVLEVITQGQLVFVFSCDDKRLYLRNKLAKGKRVVGVSQSIAVFATDEDAESTIGYFDLTKAGYDLYLLQYRNARFVAVDKDDIYLTNAKSILRFNAKTKNAVIIEERYNVRSSQVHDGSIRIIDHDFIYRALDIKTLHQLYEIRLPMPVLQKGKRLHISLSPDGQRVMVRQVGAAHLFEIVDPEFIHKTQIVERPAEAKLVEQAPPVDTRGSLMSNLVNNSLGQLASLPFKMAFEMFRFVKKSTWSRD